MKLKVNARVHAPTDISETIEIDDTEYAEWLAEGNAEHSDETLVEFIHCGSGEEFKNPLMVQAVWGRNDGDEITSIETLED